MIGTKRVGYIETDVPRMCGTCRYAVSASGKLLCRQSEAVKDVEMKTDVSGLKTVQPVKGCCNEWEPNDWPAVARKQKGNS